MGERRSRVHRKGRETNPPVMCGGGTEVPQAGWELVEDSDHGGSGAFQDGAGETGGSCGFVGSVTRQSWLSHRQPKSAKAKTRTVQ
jgi:hypothetical protein